MNYNLKLNDRPFQAIKSGTKKIEGRTPKNEADNRYDQMKTGDTITFTNNTSQETMVCEVLFVNKYADVRSMLEAEGVKNVLSSSGNIEKGVESYNNISNYKDRILKYGIYAIGIKVI
jgi:ASC-1-like (ASCH) protein